VEGVENTIKHSVDRNSEELAFLLLEAPVKSYHVVDLEKKGRLVSITQSIVRKLSIIETLGYHVEISVNSHNVFTIKVARRDRDMDSVVYMKIWDPRYKVKAVMLGGWVVVNEKWYWGQYIAIDLSYAKTIDEKKLFEFVKKLISLVI
jgi:hypothetical protein